jgi:hypothetical protein
LGAAQGEHAQQQGKEKKVLNLGLHQTDFPFP